MDDVLVPSFVKTSPHSLFKPNRVTSLLAVSIRFRPIKLDFPAPYVGDVELTALSGVLGNTTVPDQGSHAVCPDPPAPASPPPSGRGSELCQRLAVITSRFLVAKVCPSRALTRFPLSLEPLLIIRLLSASYRESRKTCRVRFLRRLSGSVSGVWDECRVVFSLSIDGLSG